MIFVYKIWPSMKGLAFQERDKYYTACFFFFSGQKKPSLPGTSSEIPEESPEIDYQMRYIAHDANVYCKTLTAEKITVSGVCIYDSPLCKFFKDINMWNEHLDLTQLEDFVHNPHWK